MRYVVASAGNAGSVVDIGGFTLLFDQPESLGGDGRGPSPLEVFVAAAGGCVHFYGAAWLKARKFAPEGLKVTVDAKKSTTRPARVERIVATVEVPGEVPLAQHASLLGALRTCPVHSTLAPAVDFQILLERASVAPSVVSTKVAAPAG